MILGILQARSSSSRLPGKVLKPIMGKPMLALEIQRILRSARMDRLITATSAEKADDTIETESLAMGVPCYRGSLDDVLDRFYQAAVAYRPDHIVRLTGDCPLIDPGVIDEVIDFCLKNSLDYASNALVPSFPDGLDVEVFKFSALEAAWRKAELPSHREHVTLYIHQHPERFKIGNYANREDLSRLRWTVDEPEDFELVRRIYEVLYPRNQAFTTGDILDLLRREPSLAEINSRFTRNEGLKKSLEKDNLLSTKQQGR